MCRSVRAALATLLQMAALLQMPSSDAGSCENVCGQGDGSAGYGAATDTEYFEAYATAYYIAYGTGYATCYETKQQTNYGLGYAQGSTITYEQVAYQIATYYQVREE